MASSEWRIEVSDVAKRANNPIRKIVEGIKKPDIPGKPIIPLSLGEEQRGVMRRGWQARADWGACGRLFGKGSADVGLPRSSCTPPSRPLHHGRSAAMLGK
jgi:hypothetical protein